MRLWKRTKPIKGSTDLPRAPRPAGVTLLGVLGFLTSFLLLMASGVTLIASGFLRLTASGIQTLITTNTQNSLNSTQIPQTYSTPILNSIQNLSTALNLGLNLFASILSLLGYLLLATLAVVAIISWGLWKGKNWARILTLIGLILESILSIPILILAGITARIPELTSTAIGLAIIGLGWLSIDAYTIFYLTRNNVTTYFKHARIPQPPT